MPTLEARRNDLSIRIRAPRRGTTAVVGHPGVDEIRHYRNRPHIGTGLKATYSVAEEADQAIRAVVDAFSYPQLPSSPDYSLEYHVGGNVSNVGEALRKLEPRTRRVKGWATRRFPVVPHIAIGSDEHAVRIEGHRAFKRADVQHYTGPSIRNTVLNGGEDRDTISLAPDKIPGGFKPDYGKYPQLDVYLTSVKGENWRQTYEDAIAHKRAHPDSLLAVAPGSLQMGEKDPKHKDTDPVYQAIKHADIVLLNKNEALDLIGQPTDSTLTPYQIISRVNNLCKESVIISMTDGADGSYARDRAGMTYKLHSLSPQDGEEKTLRKSPLKELEKPVVNPLGAGDAYAAAFYQAVREGWDVAEAMRWGSLNAAFVIRTQDAHSGQLTRRRMLRYARRTENTYRPVAHNYIDQTRADSEALLRRMRS